MLDRKKNIYILLQEKYITNCTIIIIRALVERRLDSHSTDS